MSSQEEQTVVVRSLNNRTRWPRYLVQSENQEKKRLPGQATESKPHKTKLEIPKAEACQVENSLHSAGMVCDLESLFSGFIPMQFFGDKSERISGLCTDSRRASVGDVFFAITGTNVDGNAFVEDALARGVRVVVSEQNLETRGRFTLVQVSDVSLALAHASKRFYGDPVRSLDLIGITGTNGKTTVSHLVKHLLESSGATTGMIGTIEYQLGDKTLPASRTTPGSNVLYSLLNQMCEAKCQYGVMEVSSHGIDQRRVQGIEFKDVAFLNLTRDHLDYHESMENYFQTKKRLFTGGTGARPRGAVVNSDDTFGQRLLKEIPEGVNVVTFGLRGDCLFKAENIKLRGDGTSFDLLWPGGTLAVDTPLLGIYNVYNVLAALALVSLQGRDIRCLVEELKSFSGVPGRMERIDLGQDFNVLIDYAHTEDALRNAISMLRPITKGRLLIVFGCGGDRDRDKRPLMTAAAMDGSDYCWATVDNPRKESVDGIFADMRPGVTNVQQIEFVDDRRRAVRNAISAAQSGDCVLIAGKGHETYQEFADAVEPFDDREVARELLELRLRCVDQHEFIRGKDVLLGKETLGI